MTERDDTERWMDVLAGKQPADDTTRDAARLREALLPPSKPESDPPMDEATLRRMMNMLEAKGAFADPAPVQAPAAATGWLGRLKALVLGDQGSWSHLGYVATAMAVVAVMVVPSLVSQPPVGVGPDAEPDGSYTKQTGTLEALDAQRIHAADPGEAAGQLVTALQGLGLAPQSQAVGGRQQVRVDVAPAQREKVEQALMELGLSLPADGRLNVLFVPVGDGAAGASKGAR